MNKSHDPAQHPARRIGADAFAIFAGGMAGTLARWGLDTWTLAISESYFTWSAVTFGVMVANLLGAFLLGFLGAFTTFSAFGISAVRGGVPGLDRGFWALNGQFYPAATLAIILLVIGVVLAGVGYRLATKDGPGGRAKSGRGQER